MPTLRHALILCFIVFLCFVWIYCSSFEIYSKLTEAKLAAIEIFKLRMYEITKL